MKLCKPIKISDDNRAGNIRPLGDIGKSWVSGSGAQANETRRIRKTALPNHGKSVINAPSTYSAFPANQPLIDGTALLVTCERQFQTKQDMMMADEQPDTTLLELATELTIAWLANPNTRAAAEEVPAFLDKMHGAVSSLAGSSSAVEEVAPAPEYTPAVTARKSLASDDHIISMIDGKAYKTLKRHLSGHGLTPAEYRERYGLKADYPMVAKNYAEMRRGLAKKIGLGRKPGETVAKSKAATAVKPATAKAPVAANAPTAKTAAKTAAKPTAKPKAPKPVKAAEPAVEVQS